MLNFRLIKPECCWGGKVMWNCSSWYCSVNIVKVYELCYMEVGRDLGNIWSK